MLSVHGILSSAFRRRIVWDEDCIVWEALCSCNRVAFGFIPGKTLNKGCCARYNLLSQMLKYDV